MVPRRENKCPLGATGLAVETGAVRFLSTDLNGEIGGTPWGLGQELLRRGTKSLFPLAI